ncbi:hypothetical protein BS50DRAFT_574251 [Corynespora cassiicola Philippines]|uniref:Uncharacterized protein n=1 Tax=Corynespora cassiicola Philippines TaxID=1448308 RepID=A0A2T2NJV5_CORCC|nr:hypothetical protein BS50DRAFT_574251 [Corynespora cassiicola Philippines]
MTTKRGWKWLFKDTWAPEITVSVFSWAMFGTIIFLLSLFNNEPIRHDISLNFLVSALATLSKTSLLFTASTCLGQWKYIEFSRYSPSLVRFATLDEASRGPQGSLILLWQSRFRSFASFGAIVVITSLFVDPFLQQIIKLAEQQMGSSRDSATVPRAMRYSKGNDMKLIMAIYGPQMHL